jgi:hypothetical protein
MVFQTTWTGTRKKEPPNKLRKKPVISFKADLSPEALGYLGKLSKMRAKSQFINQAIEMRFFYVMNRRGFMRRMLEYNYYLARYLLRRIGNEMRN